MDCNAVGIIEGQDALAGTRPMLRGLTDQLNAGGKELEKRARRTARVYLMGRNGIGADSPTLGEKT